MAWARRPCNGSRAGDSCFSRHRILTHCLGGGVEDWPAVARELGSPPFNEPRGHLRSPQAALGASALQLGHHAFGHRHRHELVRVRDAFLRRPDDALSHLRLGRRRT
jgi:hypothetical protein